MKKIIIVLLALWSVSVYAEEEPKQLIPPPEVAALADVGTTILALGRGATEINPLGLVGSTVVKGAYFLFRDELTENERETMDQALTSVWTGAAVNNIIIFTGGLTVVALPVGILVGATLYFYNSK